MKFFVVLSFLFVVSHASAEMDRKGNGGDEYAKDFIQMGLDVWATLDRMPIDNIDNSALLRAIHLTIVSSKPSLVLNGNEVDAINYPDSVSPSIQMSRTGWDRMAPSPHRRAFLVLHEYLGILGVDDSKFQVSLQLDGARACPRLPAVREELERRAQKFCYEISKRDLHFISYWLNLGNAKSWPAAEVSQWDFAGLDAISKITFSAKSPITVVRANAFDFVPELVTIESLMANEVEKLHPLAKLQNLDLYDHALTTIADGAFANLSALQNLEIFVDIGSVDLSKALYGLPQLNKFTIRMIGGTTAPAVLLELAKHNSNLHEFILRLDGGDLTSLLPGLEDIGFKVVSSGPEFLLLER